MFICLYHRADLDGSCSAALIKREFIDTKLIGVDYNDDFNSLYEGLTKLKIENHVEGCADFLFIVDFTIPDSEIMVKLCSDFALVWIDHHKTSLDMMACTEGFFPYKTNTKIGVSGCELTYEFLRRTSCTYDNAPAVKLIGRWDVWDHGFVKEDPKAVTGFYTGCLSLGMLDPESDCWESAFSSGFGEPFITGTIGAGKLIDSYNEMMNTKHCRDIGFFTEYEGHKVFAINRFGFGELEMRGSYDDSVMLCAFSMLSNGDWKISLRQGFGTDFDVGSIAAKYPGGGGHKGAASFTVKSLPDWITRL